MIKFRKEQKGLTMVTLVVTIIVLILLCGVVLNYVLGDNGLLRGAVRGRIMNRVQSLDDTIKAYTLKNSDPYSSKKKSVADLINEGILAKINMPDDRSIYYVSNPGLQLLGLNFRGTEITVDNNKVYTDEELQTMGIYVVDNSLNAAYLDDGTIYGKLIDFGVDLNVNGDGMYNGKVVNIYPQQLVDSAQEVIVVLDCTSSMLATIEGNSSSGYFNLNQNNPVAGYKATRWGETVDAMDTLVNAYLTEGNTLKKLTIFTYYGQKSSYYWGGSSTGFVVTPTYNITTNAEAKAAYQGIFTLAHYEALCDNFKPATTTSLSNGYSSTIFKKYGLPNSGLGRRNMYSRSFKTGY